MKIIWFLMQTLSFFHLQLRVLQSRGTPSHLASHTIHPGNFLNRHFVLLQSTADMKIIRFLVLKLVYCHLQLWTPQLHHTPSSSSGVMASKLDYHKR